MIKFKIFEDKHFYKNSVFRGTERLFFKSDNHKHQNCSGTKFVNNLKKNIFFHIKMHKETNV